MDTLIECSQCFAGHFAAAPTADRVHRCTNPKCDHGVSRADIHLEWNESLIVAISPAGERILGYRESEARELEVDPVTGWAGR